MDGVGGTLGHGLWLVFVSVLAVPLQALSFALSWFFVVYIPMARTERSMIALLYHSNPLDLRVDKDPNGDVVLAVHCAFSTWRELCPFQSRAHTAAADMHYYRYSIWGINIFLFSTDSNSPSLCC